MTYHTCGSHERWRRSEGGQIRPPLVVRVTKTLGSAGVDRCSPHWVTKFGKLTPRRLNCRRSILSCRKKRATSYHTEFYLCFKTNKPTTAWPIITKVGRYFQIAEFHVSKLSFFTLVIRDTNPFASENQFVYLI